MYIVHLFADQIYWIMYSRPISLSFEEVENQKHTHPSFYPTALKGRRGIVFTHSVWMGRRVVGQAVAGRRLSGLYLGNRKV